MRACDDAISRVPRGWHDGAEVPWEWRCVEGGGSMCDVGQGNRRSRYPKGLYNLRLLERGARRGLVGSTWRAFIGVPAHWRKVVRSGVR